MTTILDGTLTFQVRLLPLQWRQPQHERFVLHIDASVISC